MTSATCPFVPARRCARVFGVALLGLIAWALPSASAVDLPSPVDDATISPFNNVGYLQTWSRRGTGFVAHHRAVIVTAAHLFFDGGGNVVVPDGTMWWVSPRGRNNTPAGTDKSLRTHVVYTGPTGYAAMVQQSGPNSIFAFNQDIAVTYGYEDIVDHDAYGLPEDSVQRLESNRNKRIVGFAGSFYQDRQRPSNSPDVELLHSTETSSTRFEGFGNSLPNVLIVNGTINNTKLIAAAGGSGSPLLIQENSNLWVVAGVVVSASPDFLITPDGVIPEERAGIVAVRVLGADDVTALITPLVPQFNAAPTIVRDLPANSTVLYGDWTVLDFEASGWGPLTYAWTKNGQPFPTPPTPTRLELYNVNAANAGTYAVRITNRHGNATTRQHVLTVTSSPVITQHPASVSRSYGSSADFSFQFRGEAPYTVQWYRGETPIPDTNSSYYAVPHPITFADEGVYRARVTNAHGEAWTDSTTLTVLMSSTYIGNLAATNTAPISTQRVVLAPFGANDAATQFQWRRNDVDLPGATDRVLDLGQVGPGDFGSYSLVITHPRGTASSASVAITAPLAPSFAPGILTRNVQLGDTIRLERQLHAANVVSRQWYKDGQPITGATTAALDLTPVSAALLGDYTLQAVTLQGSVTSDPIRVRAATHTFWSEIPLPTATPARSGGVAGGQVFLFGDRWRSTFAAGTLPGAVDAWHGPTDVVDVCAGNGAFAAIARVPQVGNVLYRSTDGTTWQSQRPGGIAPTALAFGNGVFVAGPLHRVVGDDPWRTLTSANALEWTERNVAWPDDPTPADWNGLSLTFGGGRFAALDLAGRLINSTDGLSWSGPTPDSPGYLSQDLAHNGSRFLRVMNSTAVAYSDDGINWTRITPTTAEPVVLVEAAGGEGWFAARSHTGRLALSRDGEKWELAPEDDYSLARLVGIGGGRLYALRHDGIPLVSRPLGTIAMIAQPALMYRITGMPGGLSIEASSGGTGLSYQWYRGATGDTGSAIAGATGPQLTVPAGDGVFEAWVRVTDGANSRDSATGHNTEFSPGWFFTQQGDYRTAAWLRPDGTLTGLGRGTSMADFYHLRRVALFDPARPTLRGSIDGSIAVRFSQNADFTRVIDATGVSALDASGAVLARLDDATRVTGPRSPGYFRGGIPAQTAAEIDALVLPNGRVMIGLHTPDVVLTGENVLDGDNGATFDFGAQGQVQIAFNHTTGLFAGTWTRSGGATVDTFSGTREGADGGIVLANLSGRTWLPAANQVTIGGFVVLGNGSQRVIARGVGPALLDFNVLDAASHPTIRLFSGASLLLENTRWSTDPRAAEIASIGARLGAFPLDPTEDDSAFIAELAPGAYTFHVLDPSGGGTTLAEMYFDQEFSGNGRLANLSTRGWVDNASAVVIAGFSITGDAPRQVLLRGTGPGLLPYGVTDAAQAVNIELYRGPQSLIHKTGWAQLATPSSSHDTTGERYMRDAMAAVSAFPLAFEPGSDDEDAALLVWLDPGSYTLVVRNVRGPGGTALAEVYDVPFDAPR